MNATAALDDARRRLPTRALEAEAPQYAFELGYTRPDALEVVTGERDEPPAGLDGLEGRLSWHSLRHSAGSRWLTEYGLPVTTVSAMMGHANPSFTLACYGRDPRDEQTMVQDVLKRVTAAGS